jgi:hypothetical protein
MQSDRPMTITTKITENRMNPTKIFPGWVELNTPVSGKMETSGVAVGVAEAVWVGVAVSVTVTVTVSPLCISSVTEILTVATS